MRTLVLGDIHGANKALIQVLDRSGYTPDDTVVFLGDVVDGWPESRQAIDTLLTIPKLIHLMGNHDEWFAEWILTGRRERMWVSQGGQATIDSYGALIDVPEAHEQYIMDAKYWHQIDNKVFVHGGWSPRLYNHPKEADSYDLIWNRSLWQQALKLCLRGLGDSRLTTFEEIYVGHTTTAHNSDVPLHACEVWNLDQGAGWEGKLSIMDIDTKEYWQSDLVSALYPDAVDRR